MVGGPGRRPGLCEVISTWPPWSLAPLSWLQRSRVRGKRARGLHSCKIFLTLFLPSSKKALGWMSHWWTARATPGQMWTCTKSELQGTTLSVSDPGWGCFPNLQQEVCRAQRSHQYSITCFPLSPLMGSSPCPHGGTENYGNGIDSRGI